MTWRENIESTVLTADPIDYLRNASVSRNLRTKLIPSTAAGTSVDQTAANSQVFMKTRGSDFALLRATVPVGS